MHAHHLAQVAPRPAAPVTTAQACAAQAAQAMSVGLVILDCAGRVLWANEALGRIAAQVGGRSSGGDVEGVVDGVTEAGTKLDGGRAGAAPAEDAGSELSELVARLVGGRDAGAPRIRPVAAAGVLECREDPSPGFDRLPWQVAWQPATGQVRWLQVRESELPAQAGDALSTVRDDVDAAGGGGDGDDEVPGGAASGACVRQCGVLFEVLDVTAERWHQDRARRRERRLLRVESLARVGTWEWDIASGQVLWSDQLLALFGLHPGEELTFERYQSLLHPDDVPMIDSTLQEALATGLPFTYTHRMFLCDRVTERIFQCYGEVVTDGSGVPVEVLGTAHDITEHKRLQQELARLADHDPLTGLANRRCLTAALVLRLAPDLPARQAARGAEQAGALLLLDVDGFKAINDGRGHLAGDEVMRGLAGVLREQAGPGALVARLGGDEFAVVLEEVTSAQAMAAGRQLCRAVQDATIRADGQPVQVTVSVGVAPLSPGSSVTCLLAAADRALYAAKRAGRNQTHAAPAAPASAPAPVSA